MSNPDHLEGEIAWAQQQIDDVLARRSTGSAVEPELGDAGPEAGMAAALEGEALSRVAAAARRTDREGGVEPCFGALFTVDGSVHLIGMHGQRDRDGEVLVVDWRTPLGERFFQASHAEPLDVVVRRHIATVRGRVVGVDDDHLMPHVAPPRPLVGEGAIILGADVPGDRMRPVVATLHRAQDQAIRAGGKGLTIVDGPPGTGKTVVALNRAAYLDYRSHRSVADAWPALYLAPTAEFATYVAAVLPALGSGDTVLATLPGFLATLVDRVLGSEAADVRMALTGLRTDALGSGSARRTWRRREALAALDRARHAVLRSQDGSIRLTTRVAEEIIECLPNGTYDARRRWVVREILAAAGVEDPATVRGDALRSARQIRSLLLPPLTATELAGAIAGAESDRTAGSADPRAVEAAALMVAVEASGASTVRDLVWDAHHRPPYGGLGSPDGDPDETSPFEFLGNSVTSAIADGLRATDAFGARTAMLWNDPKTEHPHRFGHLLVDEVQDVPPEALRALSAIYGASGRTLVGDLAQADEHAWYRSVEHLQRVAGRRGESVRHHRLSLNYRNAPEVVTCINAIARSIPSASQAEAVRTDLGSVAIVPFDDHDPERARRTLAELGPRHDACLWIGEPPPTGVADHVMDAARAKGLEFETVLVVVDHDPCSSFQQRRDLYVALSRATRAASVVAPRSAAGSIAALVGHEAPIRCGLG